MLNRIIPSIFIVTIPQQTFQIPEEWGQRGEHVTIKASFTPLVLSSMSNSAGQQYSVRTDI